MVYGVFRLALIIRRVISPLLHRTPLSWDNIAIVAQLCIFIIINIFLLQSLYPGYGLTSIKELGQIGKSTTLAFILLASVSYLNKSFQVFPRSIFPIAWILAICILPVMRFIIRSLLSRTKIYGIPVIVFGEGKWVEDVTRSLKQVRRLGWRPHAIQSLKKIEYQEKYYSEFIAIVASTPEVPLVKLVRRLNKHFRKVVLFQKMEHFGYLWAETRDMDGYLGLEFHYHLLSKYNMWIKRVNDLLGAVLLLIVLSPFLICISALIDMTSPGLIFFRQERLGKDFRRFDVYKFRTMLLGAEEKIIPAFRKRPLC